MPDKPSEAKEKPSGPVEPKMEERVSAKEPIVAPDGHVVLSQEDIDARDQ